MRFVYQGQDFSELEQEEAVCWLLANGLGGYMSATAAFSVNRCDMGLLIAAETAPSRRVTLVQRLSEQLEAEGKIRFLSTQTFGDGHPPERGYQYLQSFTWDGIPEWNYQVGEITVRRRCGMAYGANTAAVMYEIINAGTAPCTLRVTPSFLFAPKGKAPDIPPALRLEGQAVVSKGRKVHILTNGRLTAIPEQSEHLAYERDRQDGRSSEGRLGRCCMAAFTVEPGTAGTLELTFSTSPDAPPGGRVVQACARRQEQLCHESGFLHPVARELARSADAFVSRRDSTGGMTILAGYPFFGDWGRDTMIALPGCTLSVGRYEDAKSILRTFLACEKDGLVPNLFPDREDQPMYNTADAALLLINCVWLYWRRTGDRDFLREAWPVMERIVNAYRAGTRFGIAMDTDGLIRAGEGLDQVTWMDVRVGDVLPTPRHGKPVELNAYWYNALCILRELAPVAGADSGPYATLAEQSGASFREKFWLADKHCLRDLLSGTEADEQIRCNQIWAVSMPFTTLPAEWERAVVETVHQTLYTSHGLRTLSPEDRSFHPVYAGSQYERDMAYHQGTVWPFPLGGFYLAWLKVHGNTPEAAAQVEKMLEPMEAILREGCVGQLPEVYDGGVPSVSKGCFAQAWSVGELLWVYEAVEAIQAGSVRTAP